jgi:CubicO group peptidase (beta-lactamase class C family)
VRRVDIGGTVAPGFEPVRDEFERNFAERGEVGAACCVYRGSEAVVDLWGGTTTVDGDAPYTDRTLQMVASATKGALAIVAHRLVERGELDLDAPVARYWPEFAAEGKERLPVRWLLSHQAGLPAIRRELTAADVAGWDVPVAAVAATAPAWEPGTDHGYHAITYGWLVGEVVNRVAGSTCGQVFAEEVARPLGLDLHIGLAPAEHHRVAPLIPASPPAGGPDELTARMLDPTSLAHWAFLIPSGLFALVNDPVLWAAEVPALNGMGTAHALARLYAAVVGEVDGVRLLADDTVAVATEEQCRGIDLVSGYETAYALGFQLPFPFRPMAGPGSFGHYGLGGSVGFAHAGHGFTFGYTVNQMAPGTPADRRSVPLVDAVIRCCVAGR